MMNFDFFLARVQKTLRKEGTFDKLNESEMELVRYGCANECGPCDTAYQIIDNRMYPEQEEA